MNDDAFNMSVRKYLKKVGVTSQREIEQAVRKAIEAGRIEGHETIVATVRLSVPDIDLEVEIAGAIELE